MNDEQFIHDELQFIDEKNSALIISKYLPVIKMKADMLKNNRVEADDLVSEGFLGLLGAIRSFNSEKGSFGAFANVCISNKMKNALMRTGNGSIASPSDFDFSEIEDNNPGTEELVIARELNSELSEKISAVLSGMEKDAFFLYLSAFSYQQIAKRLDVSIKSVDNAISRAKTKLRNYFKNHELD